MFVFPLRALSGSDSSSCSLSRGGGLCPQPPPAFRLIQSRCLFVFASSCGFPPNKSLQGLQVTSGFRHRPPHSFHTLLSGEGQGLALCLWDGAQSGQCSGPSSKLPGCQIMVHLMESHREKCCWGDGADKLTKMSKAWAPRFGGSITLMGSTTLQHRRVAPFSSPSDKGTG